MDLMPCMRCQAIYSIFRFIRYKGADLYVCEDCFQELRQENIINFNSTALFHTENNKVTEFSPDETKEGDK